MLRFFVRGSRWGLWSAVGLLLIAGAAGVWLAAIPAPEERYARALEAYRSGDVAALEAEAAALRDEDGYEPHAALLLGMARLRQVRLRDAVESFGQATEHPDTRVAAFSLAGEAFYRMGRPDDARRALSEAVRLDPENVAARRWLASAYYDLGLMTDALPHLRKIAELDPDDPRPHRLIGLILKDFENYSEAVDAYRESLRRNPQATADKLRAELAECLIKILRPDEAIETLAAARESPTVLALRAEAETMRGGAGIPRDLLSRALELDPKHAQALTLFGTMELESGRPEKAVELLERATAVEPADFEIRHKLAQAYRFAGRDSDADREERRSTELRELRAHFAELHAQAMTAPQDANVRYELGTVALQLSRPDLAAMWFETALAIEPGHQEAREALASLAARAPAGGMPTNDWR